MIWVVAWPTATDYACKRFFRQAEAEDYAVTFGGIVLEEAEFYRRVGRHLCEQPAVIKSNRKVIWQEG